MGLTVLIADDETMPRTVLRDHLPWEELGVTRIVEASDGDETVEQARACRPDILISDVKMPRKTGLEAAEAIRALPDPALSRIPIVALSANVFESDIRRSYDAGMEAHLAKPIDVPGLLGTIRGLLR